MQIKVFTFIEKLGCLHSIPNRVVALRYAIVFIRHGKELRLFIKVFFNLLFLFVKSLLVKHHLRVLGCSCGRSADMLGHVGRSAHKLMCLLTGNWKRHEGLRGSSAHCFICCRLFVSALHPMTTMAQLLARENVREADSAVADIDDWPVLAMSWLRDQSRFSITVIRFFIPIWKITALLCNLLLFHKALRLAPTCPLIWVNGRICSLTLDIKLTSDLFVQDF